TISVSVEEVTVEKEPEPLNFTKNYLVVNLNDGNYRETDSAPNLSSDTCRTSELWLKRIPNGSFYMGSSSGEVGRGNDETRHRVTLTKAFYIGVFEVTQKQYQLIMGSNPSEYTGDTRPVENVSYDDICGTISNTVADSFIGKLRAKTIRESANGTKTVLAFDLPTEAQWEYACRAGKTTALNTGENLSVADKDAAMAKAGRYSYDITDNKGGLSYTEHTKVGLYPANAWNLYDMHGNVAEWCRDFYGAYSSSSVTDPTGPESGSCNVIRGGHWNGCVGVFFTILNPEPNENFHPFYPIDAQFCRSASRDYLSPTYKGNYTGFRICVILP
ncbi:MAG: formylglycine-generating enzyme family protein, partial [Lentisphaeria bacterium]|nr:formylglycine-generating enzyme family protein [Lentisphaeria bacterium]